MPEGEKQADEDPKLDRSLEGRTRNVPSEEELEQALVGSRRQGKDLREDADNCRYDGLEKGHVRKLRRCIKSSQVAWFDVSVFFDVKNFLRNPSGGIGYHLAAIYSTRGAWRPFREALARDLGRRISRPEGATLVIVGSSGGYCLDREFLARFNRVIAVDIDPFALAVFRFRFRALGRRLETRSEDFFASLGNEHAHRYENGRVVFLFSNLLGQLEFLYAKPARGEIEARLRAFLLRHREWVSFHDRFTTEEALFRNIRRPVTLSTFALRPASVELARAWWSGPRPDDRGGSLERGPELVEHEIGEWVEAASGEFTYFAWQLDPSRTQLIEVCGGGQATEVRS